MMAGGAVQQNGIFTNPHHHNQQPHMESDPPDSRKRPLETPTEASSTKRTNTGVAFLQPLFETEGIVFPHQETETHEEGEYFLKVLIPSYAAGSIIGKGGQTIVQLQKETGATIKLSKSKDFYPGLEIMSKGSVWVGGGGGGGGGGDWTRSSSRSLQVKRVTSEQRNSCLFFQRLLLFFREKERESCLILLAECSVTAGPLD